MGSSLIEAVRHWLSRRQGRVVAVGCTASVAIVTLYWHQRKQAQRQRDSLAPLRQDALVALPGKKRKVAVNKEFLKNLRILLRIVLPGVRSKEFFLLCLHTSFLVARTLTSIYVAMLDGQIVKSIVDKDIRTFIRHMMKWLILAVPATYINSMIRFLESKLAIAFRTRLVKHVYELYMDTETYYRIGNLDHRLENPDQCLTEDVANFCSDLAHIYSQLSKPTLDIVLMTGQLIAMNRRQTGNTGQVIVPSLLAAGVIAVTALMLRLFTPPFGKLVAEEARLYGELRAAHSRVIASAEEIAFYGGHNVEKRVLYDSYHSLVRHMNSILKQRIFYTMLEQFLMKYVWGACGLVMIAIPTFSSEREEYSKLHGKSGDTASDRTQDFVTARGLLISGADAVERMMSSWKEITELAGRTERVHQMISIFQEVKNGVYRKTSTLDTPTAAKGGAAAGAADESKSSKKLSKRASGRVKTEVHADGSVTAPPAADASSLMRAPAQGRVIDNQSFIKLDQVAIVTPNGDSLVDEPGLSLDIQPGMHLLITGPNGCGKSSLFRMIGGLWPVARGVLSKPAKGDMFYIPQRPYLSMSCLREQFIYPHTTEDFRQRGYTDKDLDKVLEVVDLAYVVESVGGLDAVKNWRDVLSGGEKQRVAMARVFYHKPHFAILDECTSAVSIDVEGKMYTYAKDIGITLLTVTHRPTLWKYHSYLLQFDGQGGYKFSKLNADARMTLADEKRTLEEKLSNLPATQTRLKEICEMLGEQSKYLQGTRSPSASPSPTPSD